MTKLKGIIADLYDLNATISAMFLTKMREPKFEDMCAINSRLGVQIKKLRELEREQT